LAGSYLTVVRCKACRPLSGKGEVRAIDEMAETHETAQIRNVDKFKPAARLVEEVAYAHAGFQSNKRLRILC
jgi:hypothetical protein